MKTGKYYGILLMGAGYFCRTGHFIAIKQVDDNNRAYALDVAYSPRSGWHDWSVYQGMAARPDDESWRKNFIASAEELLKKHPRLAGVQINIEPLPSGDADLLRLLDELRPVLNGKTLSVAAYPPPTKWHRFPNLHWQFSYINRIARHCDQLAVMMYDTAISLEKFYTILMTDWTRQLVGAVRPTGCELLLGIPAYEDAGVGYHHPRVENISSALRGISASDQLDRVGGIAIYCEWEMDDAKWQRWRKHFR